jgi:hypothetical protein
MKNVLIIAYYFPPSGGPGVQRVLKYCKYLYECGWRPVVLTVIDGDYPARDESLLKEIPQYVTVYRSKIFEPYKLYRKLTGKNPNTSVDVNNIPKQGEKRKFSEQIAEFIRATFFIPDARIGWYHYAVKLGKKIIEKENIDIIYSSSPPYTCSIIAKKLHNQFNIPWVAGFRDPWTGFLTAPNRWLLPKFIDCQMEKNVYKDCNALEAAWEGILKDFKNKYPYIDSAKCFHLDNGYDSQDFPDEIYQHNEKFRVTYTGSMYGKRNPETFLKAVEELVTESKVDVNKIHLRFAGRFGNEVLEMFKNEILQNSIEVIHYVPHSESIKLLLQSEALLMIVDDFKDNEEIVPGKVFEYIGSKRPIITLAPEGAVAKIIRDTECGMVSHSKDIETIKKIFLCYYTKFLNNDFNVIVNEDKIKLFERREITKKLAQIFDSLTN